jgi:hypothetical protein
VRFDSWLIHSYDINIILSEVWKYHHEQLILDTHDLKCMKITNLRSIQICIKKPVKERWLGAAEQVCLIVDFLPSLFKI